METPLSEVDSNLRILKNKEPKVIYIMTNIDRKKAFSSVIQQVCTKFTVSLIYLFYSEHLVE